MLNTGDVAPAIELPDTDMNLRSLAEFAGSWVVVYFYPKDDTPGCTIQANEFTDLVDEYTDAVITVHQRRRLLQPPGLPAEIRVEDHPAGGR